MKNIQVLEEQYLKAKIAYYDCNPTMSDSEFDVLEKELKKAGSKVPNQVGSKRKDFDFAHPNNMLSLAKYQTEERENGTIDYQTVQFNDWYQKRRSIIGQGVKLWASPKFDGNAINIIYRGLDLANMLTRGDGETGKDITARFKNHVPSKLKLLGLEISPDDIIEIRCEVVIGKKLFNEKYAEKFANPRNYVAGVIGKDDYDIVKVSELTVLPLQFLLNGENVDWDHFKRNTFCSMNHNTPMITENYEAVIKSFEELRKTIDYPLDGVVLAFPTQYRSQLGENEHDPEWAVSIKFVPAEVITGYRGIEWNVSKRGEIIPVILLDPVFLDGSTVGRASGYNASYIYKNEIGPGSQLSIAKAGDIIPEIQKVIIPSQETMVLPSQCPACGSKLSYDQVHLKCTAERCSGRIAKQLAGALKILEIKGLGEKTIEPFAKDFDNMFEIILWAYKHGESQAIEQYGINFEGRSQELFVKAFKNIKSLTYAQVIQMLGYDNVGKKLSTQLAREHADLSFDYANLEKALVSKLRSPEVSDFIKFVADELEKLGIEIDRPKIVKSDPNETGICMTGSPKSAGYKTKKEFLVLFPGAIELALNNPKCKYLITDSYDSKSSKMKTAVKNGIEIRTYADFTL